MVYWEMQATLKDMYHRGDSYGVVFAHEGVRICAVGVNIIFDYGQLAMRRRQNGVVKSLEL